MAAAVSACGSDDTPSEKRDPSTIVVPEDVAESEFASLVNEIGCHAFGRCCTEVGYNAYPRRCEATFAETFGLHPVRGLSYFGVQASECLKALQEDAFACNQLPDACRRVYRGDLALGSACSNDRECASTPEANLRCDTSADRICKLTIKGNLGESCDQTCWAAGDEGILADHCTDALLGQGNPDLPENTHVACERAKGLYCDRATAACMPLADNGAACTARLQCPVGSDCGYPDNTSHTCQSLAAVGQPCAQSSHCAGDAYCDPDGTCHAPRMKLDGESCSLGIECMGECTLQVCTGEIFATGLAKWDAEKICGLPMK